MADDVRSYIDTPRGIFSGAGIWFHTREEQLREFAGDVLKHESIEELLSQTGTWLRSGRVVAIWGLLGALMTVPPLPAVLGALVVYIIWELIGPQLVNRPMIRAFGLLERPGVQMAGYVLGLSLLAHADAYWSVGTGLAGFIFVRWELLSRVADPLIDRVRTFIYVLPVADHVLRLVILRAAMKYDVSQPDIDRMEQEVLELMRRIDRS
jgi:hypothetical protein